MADHLDRYTAPSDVYRLIDGQRLHARDPCAHLGFSGLLAQPLRDEMGTHKGSRTRQNARFGPDSQTSTLVLGLLTFAKAIYELIGLEPSLEIFCLDQFVHFELNQNLLAQRDIRMFLPHEFLGFLLEFCEVLRG